jgi:hypothetical protein
LPLKFSGMGTPEKTCFPFDLGFDEGELIFPPHSRQLSDYFSLGGGGRGRHGEGGGVFFILT